METSGNSAAGIEQAAKLELPQNFDRINVIAQHSAASQRSAKAAIPIYPLMKPRGYRDGSLCVSQATRQLIVFVRYVSVIPLSAFSWWIATARVAAG